MSRKLASIAWLVLFACRSEPEPPPAPAFDQDILGRWDVTVQGEDPHPLWFELREEAGALKGRLQGRFGHALDLESAEASGTHLMMEVDGTTYHANLEGSTWKGTGERKDGTRFEWVAEGAPELHPRADVQWGEPIQLFNGADLTGWVPRHASEPSRWKAEDGVLVNEDSGSDLVTVAEFEDFQLHVEVNVPAGSNSGIYLRGRYEVQVQDDHGKKPHARGMGGVYGQITPAENAALPAGEWQSFDITLLGRTVSVVLNGKTIIDQEEIPGITGGALDSKEAEPGPIFLQGDHGRILYRNLVLIPAT
ncbi:MAG: 3-keto-disaccharide hydrolase [Vicinamibacteria bacterium]